MRELAKWENLLFRAGALLMLAGAAVRAANPLASLWCFAPGAALFCLMRLRAVYTGRDITVRRLRRQQLAASALFLLTAACMSMQTLQYGPARRNEWVLALAAGCVLELYTAWRLPNALSKSKKP